MCVKCTAELMPQSFHISDGRYSCHCVGAYDGWLRDAIIRYKSGARSTVFGLALAAAAHVPLGGTIVPIPSSAAKIHERGYDTMGLLSRQIAKLRPDVEVQPVLRVMRPVVDQVGLNARERRANVAGAFRSAAGLSGRIVLIDDVITTGATMSEGMRAAELAGAKEVFGFSLCAGANRGYL